METKTAKTLVQDQIEAMNHVGAGISDAAVEWIRSTFPHAAEADYRAAVGQVMELGINYAGPEWEKAAGELLGV